MINFGDNQILKSTEFYCHDCKQDRDTILVPTARPAEIRADNQERKLHVSKEYKRECGLCGGSRLGLEIMVTI